MLELIFYSIESLSTYYAGFVALHVDRMELIDALFLLSTYKHPDRIELPKECVQHIESCHSREQQLP